MQYQLTPQHLSLDAFTGDRVDLEAALADLLASDLTATDLDLVGYTNRDKLLTIGTWVIDHTNRRARALFRELAEQAVLARLGVQRVRLYGCHTASTPRGRETLTALAEILDLEVSGMTELVCAGAGAASSSDRMLDLDALSTYPLDARDRVATINETRQILQLVNRTAGTHLPRLLALAHHKLVLPSFDANAYHHLEMLLDFEYVRVAGDLVFPVEDPRALRSLVESC